MSGLNKKEFLKACKELYKRGYRRNFSMKDLYGSESGTFMWYYKTIDRAEDKYGDMRSINQIFFRPWSLYQFRDRLNTDKWLSLEPVISFTRDVDERIDLTLQFPDRSIDEIEEIAKKFGEWCKENVRQVIDDDDE
jgi:hypothetical protein